MNFLPLKKKKSLQCKGLRQNLVNAMTCVGNSTIIIVLHVSC